MGILAAAVAEGGVPLPLVDGLEPRDQELLVLPLIYDLLLQQVDDLPLPAHHLRVEVDDDHEDASGHKQEEGVLHQVGVGGG